jgi:tetratricopeptide (TPR) repeat protein
VTLLALLLAVAVPRAPAPAVRAWEDAMVIPTYEEGLPDANPPFEAFQARRLNYPYTLRTNLTGRRAPRRWRTLNLENEYLRCVVLPDLGGHLYGCTDKVNGAEMFYANTAIKLAQVAYRGAWAALGIEFNFPVSHNWMTVSPVDHAVVRNDDGSASVWVGNVDRVYGMRWRVGMTLRPARAALELDVALYNPTAARHRFYWWSNAALRVWDDSRIEYPMRFTASHGFREVDTWPVSRAGVDLSVVGNHLYGPVSLFSHGSREAFMGVYHPKTRAGAVHYSSPEDAPTKKIWSWGKDADALDWRKALSDDESAYVEVQAGLFRNQETYGQLEPQEAIHFREYWMPVRAIGGITRANPDATLHIARTPAGETTVDLAVGVNAYRAIARGTLRVLDGERVVASRPVDLTPADVLQHVLRGLPAASRYTVELRDGSGQVVLVHTEGQYDHAPESEIRLGPQPLALLPPAAQRTASDFVRLGDDEERDGKRLQALATYREGLRRFPDDVGLLKAAGRLSATLLRYEDAAAWLGAALDRETTDAEVQHYLALAEAGLGREDRARALWEQAQHRSAMRAAALLALAGLDARADRPASALAHVRAALTDDPRAVRAGELEVALLRRLGRTGEARRRLAYWRKVDPTSSFLRHEMVKLGGRDAALWAHLAGDPERVLELADAYLDLGQQQDALALLAREYPSEDVYAEPGTALPQDHPLIAYYRGYVRERLGQSGRADFEQASRLSTRFVFPHRARSFAVLRQALATRPDDAVARYLLGSLHLATGDVDSAVREWQQARGARIPVLHRNLGLALLVSKGDAEAALAVFREGIDVDSTNVDLYAGADQAASLLGRPASERVALLARYPDPVAMPPSLVEKLALALAEDGRAGEAEALFEGRFFPREEAGTNVRQVFLEVRLLRAMQAARAGRCDEAALIVRGLGQPAPRIDFTRDGLEPFLAAPRMQYAIGEVELFCGHEDEAREHWRRAAEAKDGSLRALAWAARAARKTGGDEAAWRRRVEDALRASDELVERGVSVSGPMAVAQGEALRALGREDEARDRFRRALALPDEQLSHHLARHALADGPQAGRTQ